MFAAAVIDMAEFDTSTQQSTVEETGVKKWKRRYNDQEKRYTNWIQRQVRFSQWLDDTTIHGTVHVFKAPSFIRRFVWAFIFLFAVGSCLFNIIDRIIDFSKTPSATTVSLLNQPNGIAFPAVTFCNLNYIRRSVAENNDFVGVVSTINTLNFELCEEFAEVSRARNTPLRDLLRNGRQPLEEFVIACGFSGAENVNGGFLNCSNMLVPTLTDIGYCYTFNGQVDAPELRISNTGSRYGLDVVLNISQANYLPILNGAGVRVAIHPRGVPPEPDERGIAVPPQRSAFIGLRTSNIIDDSARRSCQASNDGLTFFPRLNYSLPACRLNVLYERVAQNCCCIDIVNDTQISTERFNQKCNKTSDLPNCTVGNFCCMVGAALGANPGASCPSACNYVTYEASTSYAAYPSRSGAAEFSRIYGTTINSTDRNLLSVTIFFEEPYVERIKTVNSYTFTSLLSDIGGQLGLFLGASVISMIELGWFIFDDLWDFVKRCVSKNKKKPTQEHAMNKVDNFVKS